MVKKNVEIKEMVKKGESKRVSQKEWVKKNEAKSTLGKKIAGKNQTRTCNHCLLGSMNRASRSKMSVA